MYFGPLLSDLSVLLEFLDCFFLAAFLLLLFLDLLALFGPLGDSWPPNTNATTLAQQLQVLGPQNRRCSLDLQVGRSKRKSKNIQLFCASLRYIGC